MSVFFVARMLDCCKDCLGFESLWLRSFQLLPKGENLYLSKIVPHSWSNINLLMFLGEFFSSPAVALADTAVITCLGDQKVNLYQIFPFFKKFFRIFKKPSKIIFFYHYEMWRKIDLYSYSVNRLIDPEIVLPKTTKVYSFFLE